MTEDMKQRIIKAANQALKNSHEDNDFVDRTEVETEVLAGLLKLVQEQENRRAFNRYEAEGSHRSQSCT